MGKCKFSFDYNRNSILTFGFKPNNILLHLFSTIFRKVNSAISFYISRNQGCRANLQFRQ